MESFNRLNAFFVAAFVCLLLCPGVTFAKTAKYTFLFIGDGMGIPQRVAASQFMQQKLLMETFPAQGITTTHAADRFITGSAASATALACGKKTTIGRIGVDEALRPMKTIAEMAKEQGKKVGIVSSVSIDHATPAAFYAHVPARSQYYDIAVALARSGFDYFAGGGLKDPENQKGDPARFEGHAMDLIKKNGYTIAQGTEAFNRLSPKDGKIFTFNQWLERSKALPYDMDAADADISLARFTQKGIEVLDNDKGFFMMVEGGKIDWACHANDATASIRDTVAFDQAVAAAYEFYKQHPEDTTIVVTGDHECGGMSLGFAGTRYNTHFDILSAQKKSFAYFDQYVMARLKEDKAVSFGDVKPKITAVFGLKFDGSDNPLSLQDFEVAILEKAFDRAMAGQAVKPDPQTYLLYGGYNPLTVSITHLLNQKAGIAWTSYNHTGVPVSTSAVGVGAMTFQGMYDNTEIALKLMAVMGLSPAPVFTVN